MGYSEKEWYSPAEIIPTVYQLETFILPNLDDLRIGVWPTDSRETGYQDDGRSSNKSSKASFVDAAELAAEIDDRMSGVVDSIALVLHYTAEWPVEKIAANLHYNELDLWQEMRLMLKYVAGRNRKLQTYPQWKADKRRRNAIYSMAKGIDKVLVTRT